MASSLTVVTLLAANANRLGATIYSDGNMRLLVKLGSGASASSFTVRMESNGYYEVPFWYTGIITGIWLNLVDGTARVTELTP